MEIVAEEWRSVEGYEGYYEVSNLGRVRSLNRTVIDVLGRKNRYRGRVIKPTKCKMWGYWRLLLCCGGKCRSFQVHALVAQAFLGPKPEGMQTNHVDGNKDNNSAGNLEYTSARENCNHYISLGLRSTAKGEGHPQAKITTDVVKEIRRLRATGVIFKEIAVKFGLHTSTVANIANGRSWRHVA